MYSSMYVYLMYILYLQNNVIKLLIIQVPLWLMKKTKIKARVEIIEGLNMYIPVLKSYPCELNDDDDDDDNDKTLPMLLFGDQLMVACIQSSVVLQQTHATAISHLEGLIPCTANLHARMCLLTICARH